MWRIPRVSVAASVVLWRHQVAVLHDMCLTYKPTHWEYVENALGRCCREGGDGDEEEEEEGEEDAACCVSKQGPPQLPASVTE